MMLTGICEECSTLMLGSIHFPRISFLLKNSSLTLFFLYTIWIDKLVTNKYCIKISLFDFSKCMHRIIY